MFLFSRLEAALSNVFFTQDRISCIVGRGDVFLSRNLMPKSAVIVTGETYIGCQPWDIAGNSKMHTIWVLSLGIMVGGSVCVCQD